MVSATFREAHLGRFTDTVVQNSVPMQRGARLAISPTAPIQRGARFAFCAMRAIQRGARSVCRRSAPMQRGARFVILEVPFGVPCWVESGRQKRYKTNVFFTFFAFWAWLAG